ncbi:zinc finger MYND domain-containing protein 10-like isoform X2 [Artemia franciscana]
MEEPEIKSLLLKNNKVHVLIHEMLLISCWRIHVLPELLQKLPSSLTEKDDKTSTLELLLYGILYHEVTTGGIVAQLLFDEQICEMAGEDGPDLVDYCCRQITDFRLSPTESGTAETIAKTGPTDVTQYTNNIFLRTVANAVSILRFLACHSERLSPSFLTRMLVTHDVPMMIFKLLESNRLLELDTKEHMLYSTTEHHALILLTVLLLSPEACYKYDLTEERKRAFLKIPSLIKSERFQTHASISILGRWLEDLEVKNSKSCQNYISLVEEIGSSYEVIDKEAEKNKIQLGQHFLAVLDSVEEKELIGRIMASYEVEKLLLAYNSILFGSADPISLGEPINPPKTVGELQEGLDKIGAEIASDPPPSRAPGITPFDLNHTEELSSSEAQKVEATVKEVGSKLGLRAKKGIATVDKTKIDKPSKFSFLKKIPKDIESFLTMD